MNQAGAVTGSVEVEAVKTTTKKDKPVRIDAESQLLMKEWQDMFGGTDTDFVRRCIKGWMQDTGSVRIEAVTMHAKGDIPRTPAASQRTYTTEEQVSDELSGMPLIEAEVHTKLSN